MRRFGIDPPVLVLEVRPRQVDRQPDVVAPEPLVQGDKHLRAAAAREDTESLTGCRMGKDFSS